MHHQTFSALVFIALFGLSGHGIAMDFEVMNVSSWRQGHTIRGEGFVAANEDVVDALEVLKKPSDGFHPIVYRCEVKSRILPLTVKQNGPPATVVVNTVYAIRDCEQQ